MSTNSMDVLARALDATATRHQTVSNNIANVDTPGYKAQRLVFEEILERSLAREGSMFIGKRTDPRHFKFGTVHGEIPQFQIKSTQTVRDNNENNVDIDYEMSVLAKNQIHYSALSQQLNHEFSQLRLAITGRR